MKALIIGSGQYVPFDLLRKEVGKVDTVIAVDGGINYLKEIDFKPHVFIGDQDSVHKEILGLLDENIMEIIKFKAEKDMTDMDLGLDYAIENGFSEVSIYGATGTRLDHSLANMFLLKKLLVNRVKGKIVDSNNEIYLIEDSLNLKKRENTYVSIIPLTNDGIIVTLKGFKYPLDKYFISYSSTIGLSNEIIRDEAIVDIDQGQALVFLSRD